MAINQIRAARLGVGGPWTSREELAAVIAAVVLLLNVLGTASFVIFTRGATTWQARSTLTVPVRTAAPLPARSSELVINLRDDGTLEIEGAAVPLESLVAVVKPRAPSRVRLRAAPGATYTQAKAVLHALGDAGVTSLTFSVVPAPPPTTIDRLSP